MTTANIKSIIELAREQDCFLYMSNEEGRMLNLSQESEETILDEKNEILISIRTNVNHGSRNKNPFSVTFIETDSIKMATMELSYNQLINVMKKRGIAINDNIKNIINIQSGNSSASNHSIKYTEKVDANGKKVLEEQIDTIPSVKTHFN